MSVCPDRPGSRRSDGAATTRGQQIPQKQWSTRLQHWGPRGEDPGGGVPFLILAGWSGVHLDPNLLLYWVV